jgi:MoaA/NifB/PqqE/SkfB family radical SAM enzyme
LLVSIVTVILKQNYKYLFEIGKLILSLGVSCWDITDLIPDGRGRENYKELYISRKQLSQALSSIKPLIDSFNSIVFFALSPCVVPNDILYNKRTSLFTAKQKVDVERALYYNRPIVINEHATNSKQQHLPVCTQCKFRNQCNGIWKEYIELTNISNVNKEITNLTKQFNYLIE